MKTTAWSQAELLLLVRIGLERLGWAGMAGIVLILLALATELVWLPKIQAQIESSADEGRRVRQALVRLRTTGEQDLGPQARLDGLLAEFPDRNGLPQDLKKLNDLLSSGGATVTSATYQSENTKGGDFAAVNVSVQVDISYPKLRNLLNGVRAAMPNVAVDEVQLVRTAIGQNMAAARLRFKIWLRQQA